MFAQLSWSQSILTPPLWRNQISTNLQKKMFLYGRMRLLDFENYMKFKLITQTTDVQTHVRWLLRSRFSGQMNEWSRYTVKVIRDK